MIRRGGGRPPGASVPGAGLPPRRALLIAYGLSNIGAGRFPLDLRNDASVPGHIVATTVQLVLMLAAMGCAAAGFHGQVRG